MRTQIKDLEKRIEVILRMWKECSLKEIGETLGISKQRVSQIVGKLRKHGLPIPRKSCPKIDWDILVKKIKSKVGSWQPKSQKVD